jgi:cyclic pyranopterin phosphate synthase
MLNKKTIKDSYNRRMDYLRISITDRCNLKCFYCRPSKQIKYYEKGEVLSDDEIVRIVRIAHRFGLRKVRLTGGEPLMRKNILHLISSLKETGIHELSLTTNGIKLAECAQDLKKAGLDRVNISLDSLDAEKYKKITSGGNINLVLKSIDAAEKVGLTPVKINVVPIRGLNDNEILSFASLTLKRNYHIRFIEFMPANCSNVWDKSKCVKSSDVLETISTIGKLEQMKFRGKGPSRNFRIKGAPGVIGIISPISDHFCAHCSRLRLTSIGTIRPCLFSKEEIDIKTPMRNSASDDEIENLFCHAIKIKPQGHSINNKVIHDQIETMSKIGG